MIIQGQVGPLPGVKQTSGNPNFLQGFASEILLSKALPDYYTLLKNGRVFYQQLLGAGFGTTFTGSAGGTPQVAIWNPPGSGVDVVLLATRISIKTTGTAAVSWSIDWYGGPTTTITQTASSAFNAYSQQATGSATKNYINVALTGSSVINLLSPILSGGLTAATAVTNVVPALDPNLGLIVTAPGNLLAMGISAGLTTASANIAVFWAEIPV